MGTIITWCYLARLMSKARCLLVTCVTIMSWNSLFVMIYEPFILSVYFGNDRFWVSFISKILGNYRLAPALFSYFFMGNVCGMFTWHTNMSWFFVLDTSMFVLETDNGFNFIYHKHVSIICLCRLFISYICLRCELNWYQWIICMYTTYCLQVVNQRVVKLWFDHIHMFYENMYTFNVQGNEHGVRQVVLDLFLCHQETFLNVVRYKTYSFISFGPQKPQLFFSLFWNK